MLVCRCYVQCSFLFLFHSGVEISHTLPNYHRFTRMGSKVTKMAEQPVPATKECPFMLDDKTHSKRSPSPTSSLEVYKRHKSNGRVMVCEAREQHLSTLKDGFAARHTGGFTKQDLRNELLQILGKFGSSLHSRSYLAVAAVSGRSFLFNRISKVS